MGKAILMRYVDHTVTFPEEIMKAAIRLSLVAAACAIALPASAQLAVHHDLSYAAIKGIAEGAVEACQAKGYHVSVTVVDRNGDIVAQIRGDGAAPHTMENSRRKAYTALTFGAPSAVFAKQIATNNPGALQRATLPGVIGIAGGVPIKAGNEVIGAVGISGSPGGNDEPCSQAGIDRVAAQLR
jgi:uncharacterized protein GlcG (DUF336 family)